MFAYVFSCSSRSLLLQEVGAATSYFWHSPAGQSLCRFSRWSQSTCVFPTFWGKGGGRAGNDECRHHQLFWCRLGSTSKGTPLARGTPLPGMGNSCYSPRWLLHLLQEVCSPKGGAASQRLLGSHYGQLVPNLRQAMS